MFDHIQALSFTNWIRIGTDTLITRLTNDMNQVQNGINMGLRLLLRSPFIVFGAMVMAFTINVRCARILCSDSSDPVRCCIRHYADQYSAVQERYRQALDRVTGLTRENLTGVRVIRAFCREEQSVEEFEEGNQRTYKTE